MEVQWQFLPWKRCLAMLEQGHADGALDIFHSQERDALLLYPSEPLSEVEFVLFYANERPHPAATLDDLRGLTVGVSLATFMATRSVSPTPSSANPPPAMKPTLANSCWGASIWW